jgi:mannose-6-phosphate isomerase-like protein (cupin superfamily)
VFENEFFTQRVVDLDGPGGDDSADELLYVVEGSGRIEIGGEAHDLHPGVAVFAARGTRWSASGARAVSVLVHDPEPASGHAVLDLAGAERDSATAGRQFVLGATPEVGCASATQFVGLVPPGRAPDHFHTYDEVITILDGEGVFHNGDETTPLGPGSVVLLPARQVHCLENTGASELRLLGVFRPAGSPAEAYYPDGTPAVQPEGN